MFALSETKISLSLIDPEKESTEELWHKLESDFSKTLPFVEETIEKWNSRTKLISNLQQNRNSKNATGSVFNATIVEQVNSLMSDEQSRAKLVEKTRVKRETYRILGKGAEDLY